MTKADVAQALKHPLRRRVLSTFVADQLMSPSEAADRLDAPLREVSYHVRVLAGYRFLVLRATERVRGARKSYYLLNDEVRHSSVVREFLSENPSMGLD